MEFRSVSFLPRNDVDACRRFYIERGVVTGQEMRTMLHLQDDPSALKQIVAAESWRVDGLAPGIS